MSDFEDKKGKTDWNAYHKAQEEAGERCPKCKAFMLGLFKKSSKSFCQSCISLISDEKTVDHHIFVRCPKCQMTMDVYYYQFENLHMEGEHKIMCQECEHEFEVTTEVQYTFTSPELIKDE
jgi:uncharacterized C2H2 Zn-finger protein